VGIRQQPSSLSTNGIHIGLEAQERKVSDTFYLHKLFDDFIRVASDTSTGCMARR
jgi:hypothetical protein